MPMDIDRVLAAVAQITSQPRINHRHIDELADNHIKAYLRFKKDPRRLEKAEKKQELNRIIALLKGETI